tara:strand:- start:2100 stop:2309 length:210 start_codon:yes stop_codon:yes gene_type:complete
MIYVVIAGVVLMFGGTLVYALKNMGKLTQKLKEFQAKEKARRKIDVFSKKRISKADDDVDAPDKLEPWV